MAQLVNRETMSRGDADPHGARAGVRWIGAADSAALQRYACERIVQAARGAILRRGVFLIVLAGGETPRGIYRMLSATRADWSKWQVYFSDERCLPADDVRRNSAMAAVEWLARVPMASARIHPIAGELGAGAAARAYARLLQRVGDFDLVLLGLGADGHTASLFPGLDHGAGADAPDTLAVLSAPVPPAHRVSLSAKRLSRAREVLFLVDGEIKRSAVARWRSGDAVPAAAIRPPGGVDVLVSASLLESYVLVPRG
jgi:6-phosphogluconolactonase